MPSDLIGVCGATGRQGGATTRGLLSAGRSVRALTRKPDRPKARALADLGAEVVRADMNVPALLRAVPSALAVRQWLERIRERTTAER